MERYHMNEGHASLLTLELLHEEAKRGGRETISSEDMEAVRKKCVFTTHTPVASAHDQFPMELVNRVLEHRKMFSNLEDILCCEGLLNVTYLALNLSHYVNGVAKKHGEVSRLMFAGYAIDAITNGVHAATWVTDPFQNLYDRYLPGWKEDNVSLRYALSIPRQEGWKVHLQAKKELIRYVNRETNAGMDVEVLTLGFARRVATYKRGDLLFTDIDRLKVIAKTVGPFQIVFGGKAHPRDEKGKGIIKRIFQMKEVLKRDIRIAYLENYDIELGKIITSGTDVWLNTPQPPMRLRVRAE